MSDLKSKPFWQLVEILVEEGELRPEYNDVLMLNLGIGQYRALMALKESLCQLKAQKVDISKAPCVVPGVGLGPNAPLRARDLCTGADMARLKHAFTDHAHHSLKYPAIHNKWHAFLELYNRVARSPSGIEDLDASPAQDECNGCATGYGPHTHVAQSAEEPPPGSFSARAQEHYERMTGLFMRQNQAVVESLQKDNLALREQLEKLEKQRWEDLRTLEETLDAKRRLEDQAAEVEEDENEETGVTLTLADAIADDARARLALAERDNLVAVTNAKKVDAQESLVVSLVPTIMPMLQPLLQAALRMGKPKPTDVDLAHLELLRAVLPTFDASQVTAVLSILTPSQIVALSEILELAAEKAGTGKVEKTSTGGPHEVPGQRTEFSPPAAVTAAEAAQAVGVDPHPAKLVDASALVNFVMFLCGPSQWPSSRGGVPIDQASHWERIRAELRLALEPANSTKLSRLSPIGTLDAQCAAVRDLFESIDMAGPEGERLAALTERHPELAKLFEPLVAAFWGKSKSD